MYNKFVVETGRILKMESLETEMRRTAKMGRLSELDATVRWALVNLAADYRQDAEALLPEKIRQAQESGAAGLAQVYSGERAAMFGAAFNLEDLLASTASSYVCGTAAHIRAMREQVTILADSYQHTLEAVEGILLARRSDQTRKVCDLDVYFENMQTGRMKVNRLFIKQLRQYAAQLRCATCS